MSITVSPLTPSIISRCSMNTASFFTRSPTPSASMACQAFGASWMPAPISPNSAACSSTMTRKLRRARPSATARPPIPPPATTTGLALRAAITGTDYRSEYCREQLNCALRDYCVSTDAEVRQHGNEHECLDDDDRVAGFLVGDPTVSLTRLIDRTQTLGLNRRPACLGLAGVVGKCLMKIELDVAAQGGKVALKSL